MRYNLKIRLVLIILILLLWLIATYLLFPTRSSLGIDSILYDQGSSRALPHHIRKFIEKLDRLEDDEKMIFSENAKILEEMEQQLDLKLDRIRKEQISKEKVESLASLESKFNGMVIPVVVFACNRLTVTRCLDQLIKYRPNEQQFPIIVSQDCKDEQTKYAILSYGNKITLIEQPDQSDIRVPPKEKKFSGYFKIARHYGWALNQIFINYKFKYAIIVEDDLDISPDFFEYFLGTYELLKSDPTLWCISAWNDNGKSDLIDMKSGEINLYRTDFFPGLGWMLSQKLWVNELSPKWPKAYWDDWMRQPEIRKERSCIRPEISRTRTFGKIGVSNGLFYEKHLKYIQLNQKFVPFSKMDLTFLLRENYDSMFTSHIYNGNVRRVTAQWIIENPLITYDKDPSRNDEHEEKSNQLVVFYSDKMSFIKAARTLGLMDDFKSGVPRTAYRGIISFHKNGYEAHLAPEQGFHGYDPTWS